MPPRSPLTPASLVREIVRVGRLGVLSAVILVSPAFAQPRYVELRRYDAPEATQAVAADQEFFYAVANSRIAKYSKQSGQRVALWEASDTHPLTHLNSGVVRDGKLYCAHSNYPHSPEASSVEIWETESLRHVASHSLGLLDGSLTWIDWREDSWWAVLAHYDHDANTARDHRWTTLVKFDSQWRRQAGWAFPPEVLQRFRPHSCSGGGWSPGGRLLCSGHDLPELYWLELPQAGSVLRLRAVLPCPITGQGIAFDPEREGVVYGIDRPRRQVVAARLEE